MRDCERLAHSQGPAPRATTGDSVQVRWLSPAGLDQSLVFPGGGLRGCRAGGRGAAAVLQAVTGFAAAGQSIRVTGSRRRVGCAFRSLAKGPGFQGARATKNKPRLWPVFCGDSRVTATACMVTIRLGI